MTFFDTVLSVLKEDDRFFTENGELLRNAVYEAAMKMDSKLIKLLYQNNTTRVRFFTDVDGIAVFDKVGFGWVINNRQFLPDSYTRFKNKIGLADSEGNYLATSNDVELVFPYKDCVLEGGQTKEDQKRSEIFYNEELAPDEVDHLLYPKVFTNAKRYSVDGAKAITSITDDDNLIVKGNNLLAISSLLKRYEGQVKCIYIDPPYYFSESKSADTFGYNSNFKLSTWLVFMKNRLDLAKKLLDKDGSIWISVGKDGQHYLKVLLDSIFGANCFMGDICWQKTYSPRNDAHGISAEVESILVYSKSPDWKPNKLPRTEKMNSVYKNPDNDITDWRTSDAFAPSAITHQGMVYAIQHPVTGEYIYPYQGACWPLEQTSMFQEISKWAKYKFEDLHDDCRRAEVCGITADSIRKGIQGIVLAEPLEQAKAKAMSIIKRGQWPKFFFTKGGYGGIARKTYLDESKGKVVTNFWPFEEAGHTDEAKKEIVSIFHDKAFATPKPEKLIKQILQVATKENDLIMDYHLGSGTTCAIAHKMNRQYIGVEQMDYINTLVVNRLRYEINKLGTKSLSNSFVYCELARLNQDFVDAIGLADKDETLISIWDDIQKSGFISYKINPKDINTASEDFTALSLNDKKKLLMELLDKNQLYVNYCDIDDETFAITEGDKAFTKSFYGEV